MLRSAALFPLSRPLPSQSRHIRFGNSGEISPTLPAKPTWTTGDSEEILRTALSQTYQLLFEQATQVLNSTLGSSYRIHLPEAPSAQTIQGYQKGKLLIELRKQTRYLEILQNGVPCRPENIDIGTANAEKLKEMLKQQYRFLDFIVTLTAIATPSEQNNLNFHKEFEDEKALNLANLEQLKQEVKTQTTNLQVMSGRYNKIKSKSAPLLPLLPSNESS